MRSALFALACVLAPVVLTSAGEAKCCFTNPAYSGVCEVVPAKDETCQAILEYLNAPNTVGKSYCGGTTIRGGWKLVACQATKGAGSR